MTQEILTFAPEETEKAGKALAEALLEKGCRRAYIALFGEMGVGKTAFTRGFCDALGIKGVRSPTYTVVNEYRSGKVPVFHFDFYRLEGEEDLYSVGFEDYVCQEGYCLSEWSENMLSQLPKDAIFVKISRTDGAEGRKIVVTGEAL